MSADQHEVLIFVQVSRFYTHIFAIHPSAVPRNKSVLTLWILMTN